MSARGYLAVAQPAAASAVAVAPGTATAPGLTIAGDVDTGLFAPAVDSLALATGGVEAVRIGSNRNVGIGTTASTTTRLYVVATTPTLRCDYSGDTGSIFHGQASSLTYAGNGFTIDAYRAATNAYSFLYARANLAATADVKFNLSGNGTGYCDGSWTGGGADYAEFFEWDDGNPGAEDRRGLSVVLVGDKIRPALPNDPPTQIIGIVSVNPAVTGDAAWNGWTGQYLRDAYGDYLTEEVEIVRWTEGETVHTCPAAAIPPGVVIPVDADRFVETRRLLNPAYDPSLTYLPREGRREWSPVGLIGKLRLRQGQPSGDRWLKLRSCGAELDEWLVR